MNTQALLEKCLGCRKPILSKDWTGAARLFNGFYEGIPGLVVDLFGRTLVISNHSKKVEDVDSLIPMAADFYRSKLDGIEAVLLKERHASSPERRRGTLLFGERLDDRVLENGVWYRLELRLNQDSSFYLDTRLLREWLKQNSAGASVLNCFAYTGALGVAALAGQAKEVVQTDSNAEFLQVARASAELNNFDGSTQLLSMDFFRMEGKFKAEGRRFDLVILDPPFFSKSASGRVDLLGEWTGLINKVRPLVAHGGRLVAVNNALFLPGEEVIRQIQSLEESGYVRLDAIIPVPEDVTGYKETRVLTGPTQNAPFNHATKICVLGISRKDRQKAR